MSFPALLSADQIYLKNGDRVSGSVLKMESGKLYVKSEVAGNIQIDWDKVSGIASDNLLVIDRKGLTEIEARNIERISGSTLAIEAADGEHKLPVDDLASIRSQHEHDVYERTLHPALSDDWAVTVSSGLSLARGNSQTTNLNLGLDSTRKTLHDKLWINAASLYATDDSLGHTTANATHGGIRYDHDVNPNLFVYGAGSMEDDALQSLNFRSILGSGFGHHLLHKQRQSMDILGGFAYTRESYDHQSTRDLSTGTLGENYQWKLTTATQVDEKATFDSYLNDPGTYHAAFDIGLSTRFVRMFTWQTKLSERYVSNPLAGFKNNDLVLTTGIGLTFASKIE